MSGFDQASNGGFFGFNNLTPQQLNILRQQNQMQQQAGHIPQPQQMNPQAQAQMQQQRNSMMQQLGLPGGFNQQQLQALMAQQQSQAGGMMQQNQSPMAQMMRPQPMMQPPQVQSQMQPQQAAQQALQAQMGLQPQPPHLQQQQQQQQQQPPAPGPPQQTPGLAGSGPTFAQLSHAIEQAKKGNLTQEQMIQLRQLITRQQAMQAQQQAQGQNPAVRPPMQPGQPSAGMPMPNGQTFPNAMQRTPQMQAQAQMMAGLQQVRPGGPQSTPTMAGQGFLQTTQPPQAQQAQGQPQSQQSQQQIPPQGQPQLGQMHPQIARSQTPQQPQGLQSSPQQPQLMGQMPGQAGPVRPPGNEPNSDGRNQQQNPLNFLRLLHQRVTDIESKLASDLGPEERQAVQQQHAEAKRLQSALLQRLNVQNAQQFALLMQQGQSAQNVQGAQPQQGMQAPQQPQQPQQMQQNGNMMNGNMMGPVNGAQAQASPVVRPPNRPNSARPPQGQFGSPMLNQPGLQTPNPQQTMQQQPPQQSPQVRPSPQMGGMNMGAQGAMPGIQGVPSLRPEQFMKALVDLMKKRGTPITSLPKVGGRELDLYRFYQIVQAHGGSEAAHQKGAWPAIAMSLELAPLGSPQTQALGQALATEYRNYLAPFEETWQRAMHHQYQMSMAGAGLAQGQNANQNATQSSPFRPPNTPQMQQQTPQQTPQMPQQGQMQGPQSNMMPLNQGQSQAPQQQPGPGQTPRPPQPSLVGFNPPPPPMLPPEHLAKLGMTQEQFGKAFLSQQLSNWRQQQLQQQQRQMNQGYQQAQAGVASNMQMQPQNGLSQPQHMQMQNQQPQGQPPQQQQQLQPQSMGWPNQPRPPMQQNQPTGMQNQQGAQMPFGSGVMAQQQHALQQAQQQQQQQQQQPMIGQQQKPGVGQAQGPAGPTQQQQPQAPGQPAQGPTGQPTGAAQPGQPGQNQARPPNMSQARFIPVSPEQLEQARVAMQKIDQELATQRPRLPIIQNIADDERDQILDQVQKLAPIQATVTALLPAFYAMNGNLEPAKRLKIMAFMYKDQFDLLPKKQCILRLADLDKLKMQMSRCISFVRSSNPELAQRIVTSLGEQSRNAQQSNAQAAPTNTNAAQPTAGPSGAPGVASATATGAAQSAAPAATADNAASQPEQSQAGEAAPAPAPNGDASFDAAAAMHGIKRGLRPENLKLPPNKRAKNTSGSGKAGSPQAGSTESPKVAPSPAQAEDTPTPAGSTPAGKGGKKGEKGTKVGKATGKKGKGATNTPTLSAAEPDKKFKTSADIMAEVKREMAEAERKRREEAGEDTKDPNASDAAGTTVKEEGADVKAEKEAEERRKKDAELAGRDPAGFVESTWQDLLATGKGKGANGTSDNSLLGAPSSGASFGDSSDSKALQSLLSLLGQESSLPSDLSANGVDNKVKGMGSSDVTGMGMSGSSFLDGAIGSLPSADADTGLDIDLFDFIEASAAGPDAFNDMDADLGSMFGSGPAANASTQESEPPVETPELVASARLPGGGSGSSTSSNSTANSLRAKVPASLAAKGLDFGSAGPSSTSPAEMSSCDEIDLDKSPFVHRMRLDRIGLTTAPAAVPTMGGGGAGKGVDGQAGQSVKAPEEKAISQVELGPGSQGVTAGSGEDWWDMDHFSGAMGMGFGSDPNSDQPWAVLS